MFHFGHATDVLWKLAAVTSTSTFVEPLSFLSISKSFCFRDTNHSDMDFDRSPPEQVTSEQASPARRDSAVSSTKPATARTYGSRSSSESSRRKSSYDRGYRIPGPRRINSAPYGQSPQVSRKDAIAFHEQSCALFRNSSPISQYPTLSSLERAYSDGSSDAWHRAKETTYSTQAFSYEEVNVVVPVDTGPGQVERFLFELLKPSDAFFLTSDETRRREYAEIDRANRGLRGLWRKILPGVARKSSQSRFYTEDDGSDGESIRRYRLDMAENSEQ